MELTRRDFLRASSAIATALGLTGTGLLELKEAQAAETGVPVIWLQAQGCTGCSVSLLNSISFGTIDDLLINTLDLEFHPTVMAAAGEEAVSAAEAAYSQPGYVLVVEGAIPTADGGKYCYLWPGTTALDGVRTFSQNAACVLAVGTCAAYGGMAAGQPNPTAAKGVEAVLDNGTPVINIPGCPTHPDWIVGTIAYLLAHDEIPSLDNRGRPRAFFNNTVHNRCPNRRKYYNQKLFATRLSEYGCLNKLGCKGKKTAADCPLPYRQWNSGGQGGVNWCVGAGSPCQGCTEPDFPDGMSPFFTLSAESKKQAARSAGEAALTTA